VSTPVERAIEAAVAAGLSRVEAERIAAPTIPPVEPREAAGELIPLRPGDDRVRGWFDLVGWELEQDALRSALAMLGADQAQVDQLAAESISRRGLPENAPSFVVIPDWHEFLHPDVTKRGNNPVWVKSYTRWLSDDGYLSLSGNQRAILHGLHLEYARSGSELRLDTRSISSRLGLRVTTKDLHSLKTQGFIEIRQVSGKTLSSLEEKREELPLTPHSGEPSQATKTTRQCARCGDRVEPNKRCTTCGATPRQAGTNPRTLAAPEPVVCPVCRITKKTQALLDDHLELVHERPRGATP
jgi:hypothetical protein